MQKAPNPSLEATLRHLDFQMDSGAYVELGLSEFSQLTRSQQIFLIFHGWKSGLLDRVGEFPLDPLAKEYFEAEQIALSGHRESAFHLIKRLSEKEDHEILRYRSAAESITFSHLRGAREQIEKTLPGLIPKRRLVLNFNRGISYVNQNRVNEALRIQNDLLAGEGEESQGFGYWLKGAILEQMGNHPDSVLSYVQAYQQFSKIPSRQTDLSVILFSVIEQSAWSGNVEKMDWAQNLIFQQASRKLAALSQEQMLFMEALGDFARGYFHQSLTAFQNLYQNKKWDLPHLQMAHFYLWLLMGAGDWGQVLLSCTQLRAHQKNLGQSSEFFDFRLYELVAVHRGERTPELRQALSELLISSQMHLRRESLGWIRLLGVIFSERGYETLPVIFPEVDSGPMGLLLFSMWLRCQNSARIAMDWFKSFPEESLVRRVLLPIVPIELGETAGNFSLKNQSLTKDWLTWKFGIHAGKMLAAVSDFSRAQLRVNLTTGEIVCLGAEAELQQSASLKNILSAILKSPTLSLDKEQIALALGYSEYHPLRHDGVVYSSLGRFRDFLRAHLNAVTLISEGGRWRLTRSDLFYVADENQGLFNTLFKVAKLEVAKSRLEKEASKFFSSDLGRRQRWILDQLKQKSEVRRSDLFREFGVRKSTAANDFNSLVKKKLIRRLGKGRGIYYRLGQELL
ncbi:MAG: hypothetical protein K2X47_07240 [Bdellovibrionales bacterium]|nr:hypothetical protein [Bdellovibrionales bacterium]